MKKEIIEKILSIWDPYGVIGYGPMDEYRVICDDILNLLKKENFSISKLTDYIHHIDPTQDTTQEKIEIIISLFVELSNILEK